MLEKQLHTDMINIYKTADRECNYRATRFLQMMEKKGALATAKQLISKSGGTNGFAKLWECNRLDLSLEVLVLNGKYDDLFTAEERELCRQRLNEYGYRIEEK